MSEATPADATDAFEAHDGLETVEDGYTVTTTPFESRVSVEQTDPAWALAYSVVVSVPTLPAVVEGDVGEAVADGWLNTLRRRAEDAPQATRTSVELDGFGVETDGETVHITYDFTFGTPSTAADVAKTFVEYIEGTYVEGVVPGYEYGPPVSDLLSSAQSGGADGERGGTPL